MLRLHRLSSPAYGKRYYSEWLCRKQWLGPYEQEARRWQERLTDDERRVIAAVITQATERCGGGREMSSVLPRCRVEAVGSRQPGEMQPVWRRVAGYDLIFGGPLSLTVLAAVTNIDRRILPAFDESVQETMREMEEDSGRGLVWCTWMHLTAGRAGSKPEPEVHSHNVVFDLSDDDVAEKWIGVDFRGLQAAASHYDGAFQDRLGRRMQELGYVIESDGKGSWEIAGLPQRLLDKFRPLRPLAGCPPRGNR